MPPPPNTQGGGGGGEEEGRAVPKMLGQTRSSTQLTHTNSIGIILKYLKRALALVQCLHGRYRVHGYHSVISTISRGKFMAC